MATTKTTNMNKEIKAMQEEVISIILKRSKITKKELYDAALKNFVARNIDLLTPAEVSKYKGKVLL